MNMTTTSQSHFGLVRRLFDEFGIENLKKTRYQKVEITNYHITQYQSHVIESFGFNEILYLILMILNYFVTEKLQGDVFFQNI